MSTVISPSLDGDQWTHKQLKAIDLLATGQYTQQKVADEAGVTRKTLITWRQNPQFCKAIIDKAQVILKEVMPKLYNVAVEQALNGSFQHLKLILEHIEKLESQIQSTGTITFTWGTDEDTD